MDSLVVTAIHECAVCTTELPHHALEDYGIVCPHLLGYPFVTHVVSTAEICPATWCTACDAERCAEKGDLRTWLPEERHVVCNGCYPHVLQRSVASTVDGKKRGYELVPAAALPVGGIVPADDRPTVATLEPGCLAKLGFTRVPATQPAPFLESMWVRVTERNGSQFKGTLDNHPVCFSPQVLNDGDEITFSVEHVQIAHGLGLPDRLQPPHWCGLCSDDHRGAPDAHDLQLLNDVRTHGWHLVAVHGDEGCGDWVFTVGLQHLFQHPELVMIGLDVRIMAGVLNHLGARIRDGDTFEAGEGLDDVLEERRCVLRKIFRKSSFKNYLGYGTWFNRGTFPALQVLWCDSKGRIPSEQEYDPALKVLQPVLR